MKDPLVRDDKDEFELVGERPEEGVAVLFPVRDGASGGGRGALFDEGFADEGVEGRGRGSEGAGPEDETALREDGEVVEPAELLSSYCS